MKRRRRRGNSTLASRGRACQARGVPEGWSVVSGNPLEGEGYAVFTDAGRLRSGRDRSGSTRGRRRVRAHAQHAEPRHDGGCAASTVDSIVASTSVDRMARARAPGQRRAHRPGAARGRPAARRSCSASIRRTAELKLRFAFPIRDKAALDALIAAEAKTHRYLSRAAALRALLAAARRRSTRCAAGSQAKGFRITHVGADRLALDAPRADGDGREGARRRDQRLRPAGVHVPQAEGRRRTGSTRTRRRRRCRRASACRRISGPVRRRPLLHAGPARPRQHEPMPGGADCGEDEDDAVINPLCVDVRAGGYFPADLRGLYDITGHGFDGTGPDDRLHAVDRRRAPGGDDAVRHRRPATRRSRSTRPASRRATRRPTPSSCTTQTVAPDHLLSILENGNTRTTTSARTSRRRSTSRRRTASPRTSAMKYYASECASTTPPGSGLTNAGCNGSDVGLEEAIEDAANDPTLHSVSNSWAFGGEAEWGAADPFLIAAENSLAIAAAAGTTFYFSTGDSGTYESGYPSDSPYVVARRRHEHVLDDATPPRGARRRRGAAAAAGARTSSPGRRGRPAPASRPTRRARAASSRTSRRSPTRTPASASPSTHERRPAAPQSGQVGGTSLAAPVMNGLQAVTQNFVAAQTYPGATPQIGFVAPVLYQLGNSGHADSYFRDIDCGNTANPTSGPDGDAATKGWDAATGWGEPDWFNFSHRLRARARRDEPERAGVALDRHFAWTCAKTPSNSTERGVLVPVGVDVLRGRRRLGRHAVVRQVPRRRRVGRGEHVLQEHRRRRRPGSRRTATCSRSPARAAARASRSAPAAVSGGRPTAAPRGPTSRRRPATTSR